jgi:acyl-CoA reductase-like NAD-dependent aldehyde dehydrogenase
MTVTTTRLPDNYVAGRWTAAQPATDALDMTNPAIGVAAPVAFFPFSGWKDSFLGDLHAHGPDAVEFFTRKKTVTSRSLSSGQGSGNYFVER